MGGFLQFLGSFVVGCALFVVADVAVGMGIWPKLAYGLAGCVIGLITWSRK